MQRLLVGPDPDIVPAGILLLASLLWQLFGWVLSEVMLRYGQQAWTRRQWSTAEDRAAWRAAFPVDEPPPGKMSPRELRAARRLARALGVASLALIALAVLDLATGEEGAAVVDVLAALSPAPTVMLKRAELRDGWSRSFARLATTRQIRAEWDAREAGPML